MTTTITERVRCGALLLDVEAPGWAARINEDELDLGSCSCCVLSQVHGSFVFGASRLGLNDKGSVDLGFNVWLDDEDEQERTAADMDAEYAALATAWLIEIRARLQPAPVEALVPAYAVQNCPADLVPVL